MSNPNLQINRNKQNAFRIWVNMDNLEKELGIFSSNNEEVDLDALLKIIRS
jgi:hypothetical protein